MKQLIKTNQRAEYIIGLLLVLIGILTLPLHGCRTVKKTQHEQSVVTESHASDSSSEKEYHYSDTTKTDSSTTITKTEISIDAIEYEGHIEIDDPGIERFAPGPWPNENMAIGFGSVNKPTTGSGLARPHGNVKAKGVKITTTTTTKAATQQKGVAVDTKEKQADKKEDNKAAVVVSDSATDKKAKNYAWIWLLLIPLGVLVWYKRGWIIGKCLSIVSWWRLL